MTRRRAAALLTDKTKISAFHNFNNYVRNIFAANSADY